MSLHPSNVQLHPDYTYTVNSWWTVRIFLFFSARGGEGFEAPRGAGFRFFIENPRRGGGGSERRGGGGLSGRGDSCESEVRVIRANRPDTL